MARINTNNTYPSAPIRIHPRNPRFPCHCEARSGEAIQTGDAFTLDCFGLRPRNDEWLAAPIRIHSRSFADLFIRANPHPSAPSAVPLQLMPKSAQCMRGKNRGGKTVVFSFIDER
ncbi:MAG: hypothetical protein LBT00_01775 [Spirochaetaceae bacterium]|nr:hypothetical protein [Spirochaetaceae bacterium]